MLIFGRRHLEKVLSEFIEHYHYARPHQGLEQRRPCEPTQEVRVLTGPVERRHRIGGLLHKYSRAA